jgi:hypothetical protein
LAWVATTVEIVDCPLHGGAGKARRTAVRDEIIANKCYSSDYGVKACWC